MSGFGITSPRTLITRTEICPMCDGHHAMGEAFNIEVFGWILVERIDDFREILIDNFTATAGG